jgi:hypothetical protein
MIDRIRIRSTNPARLRVRCVASPPITTHARLLLENEAGAAGRVSTSSRTYTPKQVVASYRQLTVKPTADRGNLPIDKTTARSLLFPVFDARSFPACLSR